MIKAFADNVYTSYDFCQTVTYMIVASAALNNCVDYKKLAEEICLYVIQFLSTSQSMI